MKGFHNILVSALLFAFLFLPIALAGRHIGRPRTHHGNHHHHHSAAAQPRTKENMVANPSFYRDRWPARRRGPGPGPRPRPRSGPGPGPGPDTVQIAGSSLPDCSHACGSCSPCRLVMVSFICASLEEAETCPMAYKCMCHNKSFPVP